MKNNYFKALFVFCFLLPFGNALSGQVYVPAAVSQPALLTSNAGPDDDICPGDSTMIGGTPAASGGTIAYAYAWTPSGSLSSPATANPLASPAASTTYLLTVTDARNCTSSDSVTVTVTVCIGIDDPVSAISISLFPNPSPGEFTIQADGVDGNPASSVIVFDVSGKKILDKTLATESGLIREKISIPSIARGIYMVEIHIGQEKFSRKLIVE